MNDNKMMAGVLGAVWAVIEPAIGSVVICGALVLIDCVTAWRLERRVKKTYPGGGADGKIKSKHAKKMFGDFLIVAVLVVVTYWIDTVIGTVGGVHLHNVIAGVFVGVELLSVLENESSCNGARWAKMAQRYVVDKTERHLNVDVDGDGKVGKESEDDENEQGS